MPVAPSTQYGPSQVAPPSWETRAKLPLARSMAAMASGSAPSARARRESMLTTVLTMTIALPSARMLGAKTPRSSEAMYPRNSLSATVASMAAPA